MLQALATMNRALTRAQVAMLSGMSAKSGTFTTYLGNLRTAGYIIDADSGKIEATPEGVSYLGGQFGDTPRSLQAIADLFRKSLRAGAWRMLEVLLANPKDRIVRAALAEAAGMSPDSGTFTTYLGNLKSTGLVSATRSDVGIAYDMLELV
jgi:hypothetical protein